MLQLLILLCLIILVVDPTEKLIRRIRNWYDRQRFHKHWEKSQIKWEKNDD